MAISTDSISLDEAASLLVSESALGDLRLKDAQYILTHMRAKRVKAGTVLIHEGQKVGSDFMLLILRGDVLVESEMPGLHEKLVVTVVGAGNMIGEMSMFDDRPRAASCKAATELAVAVMSRASLKRLLHERPEVGVRFLLAMSKRLSDRLREVNQKLRTYVSLTNTLQQEVHALLDGESSASFGRKQSR